MVIYFSTQHCAQVVNRKRGYNKLHLRLWNRQQLFIQDKLAYNSQLHTKCAALILRHCCSALSLSASRVTRLRAIMLRHGCCLWGPTTLNCSCFCRCYFHESVSDEQQWVALIHTLLASITNVSILLLLCRVRTRIRSHPRQTDKISVRHENYTIYSLTWYFLLIREKLKEIQKET